MLQNDCQLLMRLQGRYVQPAAALCGDCTCQASVQPGSDADPATRAAAAAAAASFEQRCCGCCVRKLQLAGLVPQAGAAGAASTLPPPCCGGHAAVEPAAAATPTASTASSRRVSAGQANVQSVRLLLPAAAAVNLGQSSAEAAPGLLPGLLHLDIQRRAYTAPKGGHSRRCRLAGVAGNAIGAHMDSTWRRFLPLASASVRWGDAAMRHSAATSPPWTLQVPVCWSCHPLLCTLSC